METIRQLYERIEGSIKVYGKGFFNESVENQRKILKFNVKILKDVVKMIDKQINLIKRLKENIDNLAQYDHGNYAIAELKDLKQKIKGD